MKTKTIDQGDTDRRLPVIKCICGFEILLMPDVQAMSEAIENHVLEHAKKNDAEANLIRDILISQVFKKASESKT